MSITSENTSKSAVFGSHITRQNEAKNYWSSSRMFHIVLFVTLFSTVYAVDEVEASSDLERLSSCSIESDEMVTAYVDVGWPFSIDCEEQYEKYIEFNYYGQSSDINETVYQCVIISEDTVLHKANVSGIGNDIYSFYDAYSTPYTVPATTKEQNGTVYISYLVAGDACFKYAYTLVVEESKNDQTCADMTYTADVILNRELVESGLYKLLCNAKKNTLYLSSGNYNVTWYKDCTEISNTMATDFQNDGDYMTVGNLEIQKADFDTSPGEYSCSVTYDGKTRFLSKSNVCVKYEKSRGPPNYRQISATTVKAQDGKDVKLTCGGYPGSSFSDFSFSVLWYKNNTNQTYTNIICGSHFFGLTTEIEDPEKYHCNFLSNKENASKCYTNSEEAETDEVQGLIEINSTLVIRNFEVSDAGEYICRIITTHAPFEVRFEVEKQKTNVLVIALPILAGLFLVLVTSLLLYVCIRRRIAKKLWEKKSQSDSIDQKGVGNNAFISDPKLRETDLPRM